MTQPLKKDLSALSVFALAMRLATYTYQHRRMTTANVNKTGGADYNFCLKHEHIETMTNSIFASLPPSTLLTGPDGELRVLASIIALGARISLYKAAVVNVQKAAFLAPVVGEIRKMSVSAANAMCEVLLRADVLKPNQVDTFIHFYYILKILIPSSLTSHLTFCPRRSRSIKKPVSS